MAFDQQRFEALVLYIANQKRDDSEFGRTKLAKALFYSDFGIYATERKSLTGATYLRMPFGPFPRELEPTEIALSERGDVFLDHIKEEFEEKRIILLKPFSELVPDLNELFEPWQIQFVTTWTERVASATARMISHLSHDHPGWRLARETGNEIPYETVLLPSERPTAIEARQAEEIAREQGWRSDEGWIWERNPA